METIGGALRTIIWAREVPRPTPAGRFFRYGAPIVLFALIGLGILTAGAIDQARQLPSVTIALIALGTVAPIVVTVRLPLVAWRIAYVMLFAGTLAADPDRPPPWNILQILGTLLVLLRLAATQAEPVTAGATALMMVPLFLLAPRTTANGLALLFVAVAVVGVLVHRGHRERELRAESEQERGRRVALEERTRIAREMHDVVAHHMSMIAVRAETAPYRLGDLPPAATAELAAIATAARASLGDMRRLLGVLRAAERPPATAPQPGLDDLPDLVATARASGVDVRLDRSAGDDVPATVGLTAYRIVQEALANAARHAPGRPVTVGVRGRGTDLDVTVRNALAGPPVPPGEGGGHGLTGMQERVTLLGGTLLAGPDGDTFVVAAALPLAPAEHLATDRPAAQGETST